MTKQPAFSVLLPARDCGPLLCPAVESILGQTFEDLELIVIDDGTRDGSLSGLPPDPRLRIVPNRGRGIVDALNSGAALARGRWLARMDGDDIALPQRLARQGALLEQRPEIGIVGARVAIFRDDGPPLEGYRRYQDWINTLTGPDAIHREMFVESPIPHPSAVIRAEVFRTLGGYRHTPWAEDYDLWLRAWRRGVRMAKPEEVLLHWRDHDGRLSRRDPVYAIDRFMDAKAAALAGGVLGGRSVVIWGSTHSGTRLFDALTPLGVAVEAFIEINARKIGGRKRGRPVLPMEALGGLGAHFVLVAVGAPGARPGIRRYLAETGRRETVDCLFVA